MALEAVLGRMRCLAALARWEEVAALCREAWAAAESSSRLEMAPLGAGAAWSLGRWDEMAQYVAELDDGKGMESGSGAGMAGGGGPGGGPPGMNAQGQGISSAYHTGGMASRSSVALPSLMQSSGGAGAGFSAGTGLSDGPFFRAVLCVRHGEYEQAREYVERARRLLANELAALVQESYERAYGNMVRAQQLAELEEVINYCCLGEEAAGARARASAVRGQD